MTKLLIIGAENKIASAVRENLQYYAENDQVTLYTRYKSELSTEVKSIDKVYEGKVTDLHDLKMAMHGQDVVYADINKNLADAANAIIAAMTDEHVKRLIFATTSGIYDQLPESYGEWTTQQIDDAAVDYHEAAKAVRESGLDYTMVRPFWLHKSIKQDEKAAVSANAFKPSELSQERVVNVITSLLQDTDKYQRTSISIDKD